MKDNPMASGIQAALWLATLPRDIARWRSGVAPDPSTPKVFYGFDRIPGEGGYASGGGVKLLDLQQAFPNTPRGANLLYLVSSFLPLFAGRLARLAGRRGARVVLNQNGVGYPAWLPDGWRPHNHRLAEVLAGAHHVVYQSRFCKESADRFLGTPSCPWEILPNPVDTTVFVPAVADPEPGRWVVLLAGSHHSAYRVKVAIQALAALRRHLPEARLVVAGRYVWRSQPEEACQEARHWARESQVDSAVEFLGPYTQQEAVPLMQRAHVLLHTKYADPCPRLAAEAMACGLPIVYSASGGMPELVGDEAGVGIPAPMDYERDHPPDPEALARALVRVSADRTRYAVKARERAVSALDVRPWLARHAALFHEIAGEARP